MLLLKTKKALAGYCRSSICSAEEQQKQFFQELSGIIRYSFTIPFFMLCVLFFFISYLILFALFLNNFFFKLKALCYYVLKAIQYYFV